MRSLLPEKLESCRTLLGDWGSPHGIGPYGHFMIQGPCGDLLTIVASGAALEEAKGWEHVSVSTRRRTPNWTEMSFAKNLFWDEEECVIQFHPPKSQYISNHRYCLHLWRNVDIRFPMPPSIMVGLKHVGEIKSAEQARDLKRQYG